MTPTDAAAAPLPVREAPPPPPPIPWGRRARRALFRSWPLVAWAGALVAATWLYTGLVDRGHALAREEILEVRASPAVPGRIATLHVAPGAEVAAGDLVATLDPRDVDARLRFARARLERSRTRIAAVRAELEVDAGDRRAQAAARRSRFEAEGRRIRAAIDRLVAEEREERAAVNAVTPQIERLTPLAEGNLITHDRLEELVQSRTVTQARITSYSERIRAAREELAAWERLAPAAVVESDVEAQLVPFELELEAREARVAELLLERRKYEVLAPASGTVNSISARPGEWCDAGDEIARLVVAVPERVTAFVLGAHARAVERGVTAKLYPRDRDGDPLDGRVVSVGARIELVPRQLRALASVPEWGRRVSIAVTPSGPPLPGEVYSVRFR